MQFIYPKISKLESVPNLLNVNVGCNDDVGVEGIPEWTPEVFSLTSSEKRTNCSIPGRRETLGDS